MEREVQESKRIVLERIEDQKATLMQPYLRATVSDNLHRISGRAVQHLGAVDLFDPDADELSAVIEVNAREEGVGTHGQAPPHSRDK